MKTKLIIIGVALAIAFPTLCVAQNSKEQMKQRKELLKQNKELQDIKVSKASRKQAKQMRKDGWKEAPGVLPIEQQLERSSLFQNQFEDDLITPKYVWGDATSTAENYDAGKMQALELARINLVASIETNITQIVENNRANKQLNAGNAASVIKTLGESKSFISAKLGHTITVVEAYRELENGNVAVRVQIYYSLDKAREIALETIRQELEKDGKDIGNELDELMSM